jgi:hypothetical protein
MLCWIPNKKFDWLIPFNFGSIYDLACFFFIRSDWLLSPSAISLLWVCSFYFSCKAKIKFIDIIRFTYCLYIFLEVNLKGNSSKQSPNEF